MIAYLDFDYTIYDTARMEDDLHQIFRPYGVTRADFDETYYQSLCSVSPFIYDYSFEEHYGIMRERGFDVPISTIEQMYGVLKNDYLYEGARELVDSLNRTTDLILLSAGDGKFQTNKFRETGIFEKFKTVKVVSSNEEKRDFVGQMSGDSDFVFINDNLRENILIRDKFLQGKIVTKKNNRKYKNEDYEKSGLPYFENLFDIKNYVTDIIK
ncbi:MAG TPA: hypothetical protein PLV72_03540 [Candidatus Magasanikbacteria bacterium]|nr:hypothetical protein [Candidatus Magasanikbacteria bacterium]